MPSNKGLLSKALLGFLLAGCSQGGVVLETPGRLDSLITLADSSKENAPDLAEQKALIALQIAGKENKPVYIVDAWMILGELREMRGRNEEAQTYFDSARQLAGKNALYDRLCTSIIKSGEIIYDHGDYDSAETYFVRAERLADTYGIGGGKSYALFYIGKYNETKGNFDRARMYYDSALVICHRDKDSRQLLLILPSRGKNYIVEGKLNLALQCYLEALELSGQLNDQLLYGETSSHLGSLYLIMGQPERALEFDKKALASRGYLNNPEGVAKSFNNLGNAFHALKNNDSAIYYFNQSLALCRSTKYQKGEVKALINIGSLYKDDNEDGEAIRCLDRAYAIATQVGYGYGIAGASLNLADIYHRAHMLPKAVNYYQQSLSKVEQTDYDEMLGRIYKGLFECYNNMGDYKSALQCHINLLETEKKRLNVENARQLASLNISFDVERKERDNQVLRVDNALKESQIKRKTTFIWLVVIGLGFTLVLCLHVYNQLYAKKRANRKLEEANEEKDKLFSIISHELRNPLYWFQNLSEVLSKKYREMPPDKVQKSLVYLDESAKHAFHLMDNLLQWSRSKLNRIHPKKAVYELRPLVADASDMYQSILRHKDIEFHNEIPERLSIYADPDLFSCVIRNLLSNAIKFTPPFGVICIGQRLDGDRVTIIVEDSGTGIPHADVNSVFSEHIVSMDGLMQEKGSGIGLKLCKEFVEMNGGRIWVESEPGAGTRFYFTVPVHTPVLVEATGVARTLIVS